MLEAAIKRNKIAIIRVSSQWTSRSVVPNQILFFSKFETFSI